MSVDTKRSVLSSASHVHLAPRLLIDYNITEITPHVFVTAEDTARRFERVFSSGIGCVINVANELPQIVFPMQSGIESLKFPIRDSPSFPAWNYFDVVADRIAANTAYNRRTLLYCHHGRSRSITFVLAYLIKHHRLPLPTAYALVKARRQQALPNIGFWSQLKSYELLQRPPQYLPVFRSYFPPAPVARPPQIVQKISEGIAQLMVNNPIAEALVRITNPQPPYYPTIRRRSSVQAHPYQRARPPRIY